MEQNNSTRKDRGGELTFLIDTYQNSREVGGENNKQAIEPAAASHS